MDPVMKIKCENADNSTCTVRYNVQFGCSCSSCTNCAEKYTFRTMLTIHPTAKCQDNEYGYITPIDIDNPTNDLLTYTAYTDLTRTRYYPACSRTASSLCSAQSFATCGLEVPSDTVIDIKCSQPANATEGTCTVRYKIETKCAALPGSVKYVPIPTPAATPAATNSTTLSAEPSVAESRRGRWTATGLVMALSGLALVASLMAN